MLRLIAGSRGGETVTAHLLRSVTTMLIEVGSSNAGHDRGVVYEFQAATRPISSGTSALNSGGLLGPDRYKAIFLDGFLERTRDYYRDQSQKQQQELDVGSYLRWAHDKIEEERKLVETSLDAELTLQPLLQLLRAELLETCVRTRCHISPLPTLTYMTVTEQVPCGHCCSTEYSRNG